MGKVKYIAIVWRVADYGGTDAEPHLIRSEKGLLSFIKENSTRWENIEIYEVNFKLFTGGKLIT